MKQDKEILLFPILSSIFSLILFVIFVFPFILTMFLQKSLGLSPLLLYLGIFLFYFIATFVAVFFNAGVVYIAKTRFEGGDATLGDGIKAGFKHLGKIIQWSLLSATIGIILNSLEHASRKQGGIGGLLGRIAVGMLGMAWGIVSVFVVPAMVLKNVGPIDALRSSVQAIKKTWGESLVRYFGLNAVQSIFSIAGGLLLLLPGILLLLGGSPIAGGILMGLFVLYVVLVNVVFSSASTIFNTALFMYADSGKVPDVYSREVLSKAFVRK